MVVGLLQIGLKNLYRSLCSFWSISRSPINNYKRQCKEMLPNWSVKQTPTKPMASPFSWVLLVPFSRCAPSGAAYLGR